MRPNIPNEPTGMPGQRPLGIQSALLNFLLHQSIQFLAKNYLDKAEKMLARAIQQLPKPKNKNSAFLLHIHRP